MIANCGHDEDHKYKGGSAGDQTGGEYAVINWFNRPWSCVLRYPDQDVANDLAAVAFAAAKNDHIGYDQEDRLTYFKHLKLVGWDPEKIRSDCEADCSSSTAANIIAVGYRMNISSWKTISPSITTMGLRRALKRIGFDVLTFPKYTDSDKDLLPGDVLLYDGHHVAINITAGSNTKQPAAGRYTIGETYTLLNDLFVRNAPRGVKKDRSELTADGQKNALKIKVAVLKKGTKVTVLELKTVDEKIWGRIPSGWICLEAPYALYVS